MNTVLGKEKNLNLNFYILKIKHELIKHEPNDLTSYLSLRMWQLLGIYLNELFCAEDAYLHKNYLAQN